MDTTRRSSRAARASQPLPANSSTSSNSSSRGDRATRTQKTESPRKSTPSNSLSSEPDDVIVAEDIQTRRKRERARADDRDKSKAQAAKEAEMTDGGEENGEDDEAVRCLCGYEDYPGPPQFDDEESKHGIKDGIEEHVVTSADVTEDGVGFFLQCDICKVWQHGYCVSIMGEEQSPDEYFCEQCRSDLHRVSKDKNGQRYSHYLPLQQSSSRTASQARSFSKDGTRSPRGGSKNGRPPSSNQSAAKRRSTMNSRDAAYDEEEQLRRAIEASKGEKSGESTDGGTTRRAKRGRSDSEEKQESVKRQRTQSASPSPAPKQDETPQAESDDETNGRQGAKKIRGAAARNQREKEMREERERSRQEAANKRKGRAERRRAEDSDPAEEMPLAARATVAKSTEVLVQPPDPPASSQAATPDTPPPLQPSTAQKKGGRPPNARKGKLGKNQYTKNRDLQDGGERSPRSQSRDVQKGDEAGPTSNSKESNSESKPAKSKASHSKITMGDMRKRVTAILDFITRTQVEMAADIMSPEASKLAEKTIRGVAEGLPQIKVNGENGDAAETAGPDKDFKDLSCLEMMDVLTRQLVKWQKEFT